MIDRLYLKHIVETTDEAKIWYIAEELGLVMEVDIASLMIRCLWKIPGFDEDSSYRGVYYYKQLLYIIPFRKKRLYILDVITLKYKVMDLTDSFKLMNCIERKGILYFYGWDGTIVKYNTNTNELNYIDLNEALAKGRDDIDEIESWFWTESYLDKGMIYLPRQTRKEIITIDADETVDRIQLKTSYNGWQNRCLNFVSNTINVLYSEETNDKIICSMTSFDITGRVINDEVILSYPSGRPFISVLCVNNKWIILPYQSNCINVINSKENTNKLISIDYQKNYENSEVFFTCAVIIDNQYLVAINQAEGLLVKLDTSSSISHEYNLTFEDDSVEMLYEDAWKSGNVLREKRAYYTLGNMIRYLSKKEDD